MMRTFTGRTVDLRNFSKADIDLRDIAVSLSRQNRYLGHTSTEWSVGKHTILCGMIATLLGVKSDVVMAIFLHDAHETYYQDIISPIVSEYTTPEYKLDRKFADSVIYDFFNLAHMLDKPDIVDLIKRIDTVAWIIEEIFLRPGFDYEAAQKSLPPDTIRTVNFLISEGFTIDPDLIKMSNTDVAQNIFEVLNVVHFEGATNTEIVVDEDTTAG
jgi:hypothetical protein